MKQKSIFSTFLISILGILLILTSCLTSEKTANADSNNAKSSSQNAARKSSEPVYTGNGGKGITIAVPTPQMRNAAANDNWIPQMLQDLLTGDLSRYSAMTVIDRINEQLVLAEQNLSASGNYSEKDYISIGHLTNAQFIVAGNIQNVSGRYNVSFRINNTTTNEIRASFNKQYLLNDIETGLAAKEAVRELLVGMGIELTEAGEKTLLAIQPIEVRGTAQLAKGAAAIKSDNIVDALAFFSEALNSNSTRTEANRNIQNVFGSIPTNSIKERANYVLAQKERWEKIFKDLRKYLDDKLTIVVYDFSFVEDKLSAAGTGNIIIKILPGVKVIPDRAALLVYKRIIDEWEQVRNMEENKTWARTVQSANTVLRSPARWGRACYVKIGLYDEHGDIITTTSIDCFFSTFNVIAQQKYYEDTKFKEVSFLPISIKKITDTITPKIVEVGFFSTDNRDFSKKLDPPIMTVAEWQTSLL